MYIWYIYSYHYLLWMDIIIFTIIYRTVRSCTLKMTSADLHQTRGITMTPFRLDSMHHLSSLRHWFPYVDLMTFSLHHLINVSNTLTLITPVLCDDSVPSLNNYLYEGWDPWSLQPSTYFTYVAMTQLPLQCQPGYNVLKVSFDLVIISFFCLCQTTPTIFRKFL